MREVDDEREKFHRGLWAVVRHVSWELPKIFWRTEPGLQFNPVHGHFSSSADFYLLFSFDWVGEKQRRSSHANDSFIGCI